MQTLVTCPDCSRELKLPDEFLNQTVQCPGCARNFVARRDASGLVVEELGRAEEAQMPAPTYRLLDDPHVLDFASQPHPHSTDAAALDRPRRSRRKIAWKLPNPKTLTLLIGIGILILTGIGFGIWGIVRYHRAAEAAKWQRFAPQGAGASVRMPGAPALKPVPDPNFNGSFYVLELDRKHDALIFGYVDLPPDAVEQGVFLQRAKADAENLAGFVGGEVFSEAAIWLGPHEGREFRINRAGKHGSGGCVMCRVYLVKRGGTCRAYTLMVGGPGIEPGDTTTRRFFDSFQLDD